MAEPFLAEVRLMSFGFAPKGWALCTGQLMPINQNQALFSLLGTSFGGDGRVNFALPDLRGRVPVHMANGLTIGQRGGEENHTLTIAELTAHQHVASADAAAGHSNTYDPTGALPANVAPTQIYSTGAGNAQIVPMFATMVSQVGGSQPHSNQQPYLTVSFCIALQGIFPSRN